MASHSPESAIPDQKPTIAASPEQDGRNGTPGINGHASPSHNIHEPTSKDTTGEVDKEPTPGSPLKANAMHNEEAIARNQAISAEAGQSYPSPKEQPVTTPAKPEGPSAADLETGARDDEPVPDPEKKVSPAPAEDKPSEAPRAPEASHMPATQSSEPEPAPINSPAPQEAKADDVEMTDAPANADASPGPEKLEGVDDKKSADVPPDNNKPSPVAAESPKGSQAATDVSMADVLSPTSKVSRGREEDGEEDGPLAKRFKVDDARDVVEVKTHHLFKENGEPKSLADASLDGLTISQSNTRKIRAILAGIKKTKAGMSFRAPVGVLWPHLWQDYQAKVHDPVDISTMEKRLKGSDPSYKPYLTMGEFKRDLQRLCDNSILFNGETHEVTRQARTVKEQVLDRMALESAADAVKTDKRESMKHHPPRHPGPRPPQHQSATPIRRPSKPAAVGAVDRPLESPAFAIPPNNNGVPLIRRDSTKNADDRPKRPIHPPKNKDLGYEPKKKKKLSPELRFCDEILTELKKAKYYDINSAFMVPVDPIALNIPNYHKVVKRPMDLQTMAEKLYAGQYSNAKEFEKDFGLIIKNCRIFNGDDHFVTKRAFELDGLFKREWAKKDDWLAKHAPASVAAAAHASAASPHQSEDDAESEVEGGDEKEHSSATLEALQRRLDEENEKLEGYLKSKNPDIGMVEVSQGLVMMLQKQIIQERQKLSTEASSKKSKLKQAKSKKVGGGGPKKAAGFGGGTSGAAGGGGGAGGASKKSTGGAKKKRVIGAVEKEVIAAAVSMLDGDALNRAIDIIKKDTNENENDSGELELDLDALSQDALSKLFDISVKAFPSLKAEKEKQLSATVAHSEPSGGKAKPAATKPKKNKPMSKAEQERRIEQLRNIKASLQNRASGSQEPVESIEGPSSALSPHDDALLEQGNESDESSEEE